MNRLVKVMSKNSRQVIRASVAAQASSCMVQILTSCRHMHWQRQVQISRRHRWYRLTGGMAQHAAAQASRCVVQVLTSCKAGRCISTAGLDKSC
jgi:hypothetical protein